MPVPRSQPCQCRPVRCRGSLCCKLRTWMRAAHPSFATASSNPSTLSRTPALTTADMVVGLSMPSAVVHDPGHPRGPVSRLRTPARGRSVAVRSGGWRLGETGPLNGDAMLIGTAGQEAEAAAARGAATAAGVEVRKRVAVIEAAAGTALSGTMTTTELQHAERVAGSREKLAAGKQAGMTAYRSSRAGRTVGRGCAGTTGRRSALIQESARKPRNPALMCSHAVPAPSPVARCSPHRCLMSVSMRLRQAVQAEGRASLARLARRWRASVQPQCLSTQIWTVRLRQNMTRLAHHGLLCGTFIIGASWCFPDWLRERRVGLEARSQHSCDYESQRKT